jgi:hypothetical protein
MFSMDQIQLLTDPDDLKLRTSDSTTREFVSWYKQTTFKRDLVAFLETVAQ